MNELFQELSRIQDDTQDPRTAKELAAVIKKYEPVTDQSQVYGNDCPNGVCNT